MPSIEKVNFWSYDEIYLVDPKEILYIKAEDHYCQVTYYSGLSFMLPYGLGQLDETFVNNGVDFLKRFGRKYIININHIVYASTIKQLLVLGDGSGKRHSLRISKPVIREFIESNRIMENGT